MKKLVWCYAIIVLAIASLFLNAFSRSMVVQHRLEVARIERFPVMTYHQCAEEYHALLKMLAGRPTHWREYFQALQRADMLVGSAQKAIQDGARVPVWDESRDVVITRGIPVEIRPWLNEYANYVNTWDHAAEWKVAYDEYLASGFATLHEPNQHIPGEEYLSYWWLIFHFGSAPFVFIHYAIRIRQQGGSVWLRVCSDPLFPFAVLLWEIGMFIFPKVVDPMVELRRAQRFGMLVLSSALSCFAGSGKPCEKPERAPQHQKYKGGWMPKLAFSTQTISNYIGFDGASFFPGVDQWTTITATFPCGFSVSFFDAEPITRRGLRPNFGRETDLIVGWSGKIRGNVLELSTTYLNTFPISQVPRGDVIQFSERVSRMFAVNKRTTIGPHVWLRQAIPVRGPTPIGGWFVHVGGTVSRKFGEGHTANVLSEAVYDSGAFGFNSGYIGRLTGNLTWKLGKHVSLQLPLVTLTKPLSRTGDGRMFQSSFGVGFSFSQ